MKHHLRVFLFSLATVFAVCGGALKADSAWSPYQVIYEEPQAGNIQIAFRTGSYKFEGGAVEWSWKYKSTFNQKVVIGIDLEAEKGGKISWENGGETTVQPQSEIALLGNTSIALKILRTKIHYLKIGDREVISKYGSSGKSTSPPNSSGGSSNNSSRPAENFSPWTAAGSQTAGIIVARIRTLSKNSDGTYYQEFEVKNISSQIQTFTFIISNIDGSNPQRIPLTLSPGEIYRNNRTSSGTKVSITAENLTKPADTNRQESDAQQRQADAAQKQRQERQEQRQRQADETRRHNQQIIDDANRKARANMDQINRNNQATAEANRAINDSQAEYERRAQEIEDRYSNSADDDVDYSAVKTALKDAERAAQSKRDAEARVEQLQTVSQSQVGGVLQAATLVLLAKAQKDYYRYQSQEKEYRAKARRLEQQGKENAEQRRSQRETMYLVDLGVKSEDGGDYTSAFKYYQQAAERKNSIAMRHLAQLYNSGQGISKDEDTAISWYKKAAELGDHASDDYLISHAKLRYDGVYRCGTRFIRFFADGTAMEYVSKKTKAPLWVWENKLIPKTKKSFVSVTKYQLDGNTITVDFPRRRSALGGVLVHRFAYSGTIILDGLQLKETVGKKGKKTYDTPFTFIPIEQKSTDES